MEVLELMPELSIPPPSDKPGRWRCHLCPWPRWTEGTYTDWQHHYATEHQGKD
jgi:hypothetical protein